MVLITGPHGDRAEELFGRGLMCSRAVLTAFAGECGMSGCDALRLGPCLGSGMRRGEVCGACTGALIVPGPIRGRTDPGDRASRGEADALTGASMDRFADGNGSCICRDPLGCGISTPEGVSHAVDGDLSTALCPRFVRSAADIPDSLVGDP